jgi:two-component system, NarL family, response regulator NreC
MPIKILVADDHPLVVAALRAAFQIVRDIQIVGDTGSGDEVLGLVDKLQPDVLVLDLKMPGTDGLEVLRRLREAGATVRVVVLSMHDTASYAARAVKLGALGYVPKSAPAMELYNAIRAAAAGERYLAPPLSDSDLREYEHRLDTNRVDLFDTLSPREREVMKLTALGGTSTEVAHTLGIGRRTVESYLANATEKLGIKTRSDLVRYAVRVGLVSDGSD